MILHSRRVFKEYFLVGANYVKSGVGRKQRRKLRCTKAGKREDTGRWWSKATGSRRELRRGEGKRRRKWAEEVTGSYSPRGLLAFYFKSSCLPTHLCQELWGLGTGIRQKRRQVGTSPTPRKGEWTLVHHSGAEFPKGDSKLKRAFRGAQPGKVSGKESGKASLWSVGCERMPCGPGKEGPGAGQTGGHWPVHWSHLMAAHRSEPGGYFHRNPQGAACRLWAVLHTPRVTCTGTSQATQYEMEQDRGREELRTERALLTELA